MSLRQKKVFRDTYSFNVQVRCNTWLNLVEELGFVQGLFLHALRVQPKEERVKRSEDPRGWDTHCRCLDPYVDRVVFLFQTRWDGCNITWAKRASPTSSSKDRGIATGPVATVTQLTWQTPRIKAGQRIGLPAKRSTRRHAGMTPITALGEQLLAPPRVVSYD